MLHLLLILGLFKQISGNFSNIDSNLCKSLRFSPFWYKNNNCYYNPYLDASPEKLALQQGYLFEEYDVETKDGYVLTIFRIPSINNSSVAQPVFLQHGLMANARTWLNYKNDSLAYYLADNGYDVWLGNFRGSTFSNKNKKYKMKNKKFWDYTIDDLAKYDLSANLKFIAEKTGQAGHIIYIGHSQGTTTSFMYASDKENDQKLVCGIIALSPVAFFYKKPGLIFLGKIAPLIHGLLSFFNIYGLFYQDYVIPSIRCQCKLTPIFCKFILDVIYGKSMFYPDLLQIFSNFPTGISVNQLVQYGQIASKGLLQKYDYGKSRNLIKYGQLLPPTYDLGKIKVPVILFYGRNDVLATEYNVQKIYQQLGSDKKIMQVIPKNTTLPSFNHIDFTNGKELKELLYSHMFAAMKKYFSV